MEEHKIACDFPSVINTEDDRHRKNIKRVPCGIANCRIREKMKNKVFNQVLLLIEEVIAMTDILLEKRKESNRVYKKI